MKSMGLMAKVSRQIRPHSCFSPIKLTMDSKSSIHLIYQTGIVNSFYPLIHSYALLYRENNNNPYLQVS